MQTHGGAMKDFYRYLGIRRKLMCLLLWIFAATEATRIMKVVGSEVKLPCINTSTSSLTQLSWKMDKILLFSYVPDKLLHVGPKARTMTLNMSRSEDELYQLIIERVDASHTGNYTCEASTTGGVLAQTWQLIITDAERSEEQINPLILVAAIVPCVCCLIFIISLPIVWRSCKHSAENSRPPAAEPKPTEEIYENCLEINTINTIYCSGHGNHRTQ